MTLVFETTPTGTRRAKQKCIQDGITGELEVPSGKIPGQNAWLTLTLNYGLTFLDRRTPDPKGTTPDKRVLFETDGAWYARDRSGFMFPILDWNLPNIEAFHKRFRAAEGIWNRRFVLQTPMDYTELDYASGGVAYRPNVLCLFRMVSGPARHHINLNVVRVDPSVTEVFHQATGELKKVKYPSGFRSDEVTLSEADWRRPVLGHELGHALGMTHIKGLLGDHACLADANAERCYGTTPEELANIMGVGDQVTTINALPWQRHVDFITRIQKDRWVATLTSNPGANALSARVVRSFVPVRRFG